MYIYRYICINLMYIYIYIHIYSSLKASNLDVCGCDIVPKASWHRRRGSRHKLLKMRSAKMLSSF